MNEHDYEKVMETRRLCLELVRLLKLFRDPPAEATGSEAQIRAVIDRAAGDLQENLGTLRKIVNERPL